MRCWWRRDRPLVMALIQTGKIEAIVGVSCISVLERAFPYMESAAIPGVAIPLLQDDCKDTAVDVEWVWDFIHTTSDDRTRRLDLDALRKDVESWFEPSTLDALFGGPAASETETLARAELTRAGKRWRPFLTVCVHQALQDDPHAPAPDALRQVDGGGRVLPQGVADPTTTSRTATRSVTASPRCMRRTACRPPSTWATSSSARATACSPRAASRRTCAPP